MGMFSTGLSTGQRLGLAVVRLVALPVYQHGAHCQQNLAHHGAQGDFLGLALLLQTVICTSVVVISFNSRKRGKVQYAAYARRPGLGKVGARAHARPRDVVRQRQPREGGQLPRALEPAQIAQLGQHGHGGQRPTARELRVRIPSRQVIWGRCPYFY